MTSLHKPLLALLLASSGAIAAAQPASAPAAVGVTPGTAAVANEKAVPRSDVGTVVRTGPTALEKARDAMANDTGSTAVTPGATTRADPAAADSQGGVRQPRADRN